MIVTFIEQIGPSQALKPVEVEMTMPPRIGETVMFDDLLAQTTVLEVIWQLATNGTEQEQRATVYVR